MLCIKEERAVKKFLFSIVLLTMVVAAHFIACGGGDDDDDIVGDNDADDADDDADDDTGDDDTGDDDVTDDADDVVDDITDDTGDDDGCSDSSGMPVTLCNPVYDNTLDYNAGVLGWPIPMLTVTYDGAILSGYQLVLDCSSYRPSEIFPWPVPLTIYVGGPETGQINVQGYVIPYHQTGPFSENQTYTCPLYIADGVGAETSNELSITVTLGDKP
jgi:hypothetical protein